jgi:hypothetical protein
LDWEEFAAFIVDTQAIAASGVCKATSGIKVPTPVSAPRNMKLFSCISCKDGVLRFGYNDCAAE